METAGSRFRLALKNENPLQVVGTINAISALMAQSIGFQAIYLSGAGVANASLGLPDLGLTTLQDVLEDARRITNRVSIPLLVDIDTGFGHSLNISRTIKEMIQAGVAAVHIEDQDQNKRCGHLPQKKLVSPKKMVARLHAALDAKTDANFVIIARTDALAVEGLAATLERIHLYIEAGAEIIFFEGAKNLEEYQTVVKSASVPVLANITEFGVTPLFTKDELAAVGVKLILYPLSLFRAMNFCTLSLLKSIREEGTQKNKIMHMQTREELYALLHYYQYQANMDKFFNEG